MKIAVDPLECGCSGYCVRLAPTIFAWLPDATAAHAPGQPVTEQERRLAREAAEVCPAHAIAIVDETEERTDG